MKNLSIDIETYSSVDIRTGGAYKYALSPDFEILLFGYSVDFGSVNVVDLTAGEAIPADIVSALADPEVIKHAYNAAFEWWCLNQAGYNTPLASWHCTMIHALYLGYPAGLKATGRALGLSDEELKSSTGTLLINYFCKPRKPTKGDKRTRNLPGNAPEKWATFIAYNRQDVVAEMAIFRRLEAYPVPEYVQKGWVTDVHMNAYGMAVDMGVVDGALSVSDTVTSETLKRMQDITKIENPNSGSQLMEWLESQNAPLPNLRKVTVEKALEGDLPDQVRKVLRLKQRISKTSIKKYAAMREAGCGDGRIRGLLQYYGSHTGRWAGRLVQVQNLPRVYMRPGMLDLARSLVKEEKIDQIETIFGDVPDTLSQLIRTALAPGEGKTVIVADFSAIEARVVAWLAGETWRQEAFAAGKDIYCESASQMFGVPVEKHGINGELRQTGKVAELALGYQGWTGAMIQFGALDKGLTEGQLPEIILSWRAASPHIVEMWKSYENAALYTLETGEPVETNRMTFLRIQDPVYGFKYLTIELPSGRKLYYPDAHIDINDKGRKATFYKVQTGTAWSDVGTYGGKLTENITQATARDCLQEAIWRITELDPDHLKIVAHVHDEVICEYDGDNPEEAYNRMVEAMCAPISWAPGLLLTADGYVSDYYKKD
ncbi:MAG: DNA polymerase [Eubacteriales bacterium]|nr:DNA polymerase [Eubacteriales bacterium]